MWQFQVSGSSPDTGNREIRPSWSFHVLMELFICSSRRFWATPTSPISLILLLLLTLLLLLLPLKRSLPPSYAARCGGSVKQRLKLMKLSPI